MYTIREDVNLFQRTSDQNWFSVLDVMDASANNCNNKPTTNSNRENSGPYCYFSGSSDNMTPNSNCVYQTGQNSKKCENSCGIGGSAYEAMADTKHSCGGPFKTFYCLAPRQDTCLGGKLNLSNDNLMDVRSTTQSNYTNVPDKYYDECAGGQTTWFMQPYHTTRVPNATSNFSPQACVFDLRSFTSKNQVEDFKNMTNYRHNMETHELNTDDIYTYWCGQQIKDSCQNGKTTCPRYMSTNAEGKACQTYVQDLIEKQGSNALRGWKVYNTIAQNYCVRYPTDQHCGCVSRNIRNTAYTTLKQGAPYNDGCWWAHCAEGDINKMFVTNEVAVQAQEGMSDLVCPKCACTNSQIFYNDNDIDISDNQVNIMCNDLSDQCSDT